MIIESTEKERMIKVMTKEIAIHNLFVLKLRTRVLSDRDALGMAIKALEQQPREDCISRQAVLDIINFEDKWLYDAKSHNADTKIAFSGLESRVKALPSVTPTSDAEDKYDIGYNCGYADAMSDIAGSEG
jgi:hypothetical protein